MKSHVTKKEGKLLEELRKGDYSRDKCIQIWNDLRNGFINRVPLNFWKKHNHRVYITEEFVKEYQEENPDRYPGVENFKENKLRSLMRYCSNSPFIAFQEAGFMDKDSENYDPKLDEVPWMVLDKLPQRYWDKTKNVRKAVDFLAENIDKEVIKLEEPDFRENNLFGLLSAYNGSPIDIIRKAEYKIDELDRNKVPLGKGGYWSKKVNIIKHTIRLVEKSDKPFTEIKAKDFKDNGLGRLLNKLENSPSKALNNAGYEFDILDLPRVPVNHWKNSNNRKGAVRDFVKELDKPIEEIRHSDFRNSRLSGLIASHYKDHYKDALIEAGLLN